MRSATQDGFYRAVDPSQGTIDLLGAVLNKYEITELGINTHISVLVSHMNSK